MTEGVAADGGRHPKLSLARLLCAAGRPVVVLGRRRGRRVTAQGPVMGQRDKTSHGAGEAGVPAQRLGHPQS